MKSLQKLEREHLTHSALGDARNCLANVQYLKTMLGAWGDK